MGFDCSKYAPAVVKKFNGRKFSDEAKIAKVKSTFKKLHLRCLRDFEYFTPLTRQFLLWRIYYLLFSLTQYFLYFTIR